MLHLRDGGHHLEQINDCHLIYLPLYYVLFFPYRKFSCRSELQHLNGRQCLTLRCSFVERIFLQGVSYVLGGRKLFQQIFIDVWALTKQN